MLKVIRTYFTVASRLFPGIAARQAIKLFQRTRNIPYRNREKPFYEKAEYYTIPHVDEPIHVFELGPKDGEVIFLIHGWDSHAGSMSGIGEKLADMGYRVILPDLPAHGKSALTHTNLFRISGALERLIRFTDPQKFSIVAHSFGSAASIYTLHRLDLEVEKLILLSSPNRMHDVFSDYKKLIGLSNRSFLKMKEMFINMFGISLEEMRIDRFVQSLDADKILFIHDKSDKIIPYQYSEEISARHSRSEITPINKVGHYRMLWNEDVINIVGKEFIHQADNVSVPDSLQVAV